MLLADLKVKTKERISSLDELRKAAAEDFEIEGIGTVKVTWALPKDYMKLAMDRLSIVATETPEAGKTMDYFKSIVKLCVIDPELDNESIDLLVEAMGVKFAELANKCIDLSSGVTDTVENAEAIVEQETIAGQESIVEAETMD